MVAVTEVNECTWSVSMNSDDLQLVNMLSSLQLQERREIVCQVVALGLISYANIMLDDMQDRGIW